ncbi:hypothetical protein OAN84_05865 [Planktomarina temperata]|nr:hypothetical protein [Planktomarina temperata]
MYKDEIAIIGASSFIGSALSKYLAAKNRKFIQISSRNKNLKGRKTSPIYWDYSANFPNELENASTWVICCFDHNNYLNNLDLIAKLIDHRTNQRIIYLSSYITIKNNNPVAYRSGGDDYCRVKKSICRMLLKSVHSNDLAIFYPGVVLGRGGRWQAYFESLKKYEAVMVKNLGINTVRTISINNLVQALSQSIDNFDRDPHVVLDLVSNQDTVRSLLLKHAPNVQIKSSKTNREFFDSWLKNFVLQTLCSKYIPDNISVRLFKKLRELNKKSTKIEEIPENYTIDGPTRVYLEK